MRVSFRKRRAAPAAPRLNQWKDPSGEKAVMKVGRMRTARRQVAVRLGVPVTGVVILGWLITMAVTYFSRIVRELLEIHTITVEGVHHLDKQKNIKAPILRFRSAIYAGKDLKQGKRQPVWRRVRKKHFSLAPGRN